MNGWSGPFVLLVAAGVLPVVAPSSLRDAGWIPDATVLVAVLVAGRATPERAALFGLALGAIASLFTPEPVLFRPWLLGTVAWGASHAATAFRQDSTRVRMALVAVAVLTVRGAEHVAAALAGADAAWSAAGIGRSATAAVLCAAVSALAAPLAFGAASRWRLAASLERTFRDV